MSTTPHHNSMKITTTPNELEQASNDYGNIVHHVPTAVLHPSSVQDIVDLIKSSNNSSTPFAVAARGCGHSVRGQAMARGGVVVEMSSLGENGGDGIRVCGNSSSGFYADVGGEQLWIDVLRATLEQGMAPVSWTDYLHLSVGGTLSNGGISGQAFQHGPQIANVLQLVVITGEGEVVTCSEDMNSELFFAVLGGLGQFGIIARARIVLHKAPTRVKWARLIYSDFSAFKRDEEFLISSNGPNYVEGFIITNDQSKYSFSPPSLHSHMASLFNNHALLYSIELVKYYQTQSSNTIDQEFQTLMQRLNFIPGLHSTTDVSFFDFLNRVGDLDHQKRRSISHPWLNLFIPQSRILDFNDGVIATMIPTLNNTSNSLFILYPMNRNKWDDRMSAVIPEEDVFYNFGLLHSSESSEYEMIDEFNDQILGFCKEKGIEVKQYLPHYKSKTDWIKHYGSKWEIIQRRKAMFDHNLILSPGQSIFNDV